MRCLSSYAPRATMCTGVLCKHCGVWNMQLCLYVNSFCRQFGYILIHLAQRAVNHPTLDRTGRVRMDIPVEFDLNDLISFLGERQGRFNIRASQAWGSLYVLDLGETYKFLRSLSDYNGNSRSNFLEFIDRRIVESKDKSKNWLTCVKDCDPVNNFYVSTTIALSCE